jgi:hypothetical protein
VVIRPLTDADVDAVVASLDAWAPVFASSETVMGPRVYGLVHPDWRTAQARAVAQVCRSLDTWVADVDGTRSASCRSAGRRRTPPRSGRSR